MHKKILKISIPALAANIFVPIMGIVDMSIAGHLGSIYTSAISVGTTILNLLYWNFGFLRMGTSGLTAQAYGEKNNDELANILLRSILVSLSASILIILLNGIIQKLAFNHMTADAIIEEKASIYLNICIIGVPATMCLYSIKGWLIGLQNTFRPMLIALVSTIINIACSIYFTQALNWGIEGIALGTVVAEYCALIFAILLIREKFKPLIKYVNRKIILEKEKLKKFFVLNGGIAIRTLCLSSVTYFFSYAGTTQDTVTLATNALLLQFFTIFSFFTDGFSYAGEALTGKYIGAREEGNMKTAIKTLFTWGIFISFSFTLIYTLFSQHLLQLLTNDHEILQCAPQYTIWIIAIPLCSFSAFLWDGIMIGATMTKGMVVSMVCATLIFFATYSIFISTLGNHGLWLAFVLYLMTRGLSQSIYFKHKIKQLYPTLK